MAPITKFDKATSRYVAEAVVDNLREFCDEFGLTAEPGSGTFSADGDTFEVKVKFTLKGADPAAAAFRRYAEMFGLEPDMLGKTVQFGREAYTIIGLDPKKRRQPVVLKRNSDGRSPMLASVEAITRGLRAPSIKVGGTVTWKDEGDSGPARHDGEPLLGLSATAWVTKSFAQQYARSHRAEFVEV